MNKFYITTAIDYVNAKPHIGHALEKVEADVLARYHRVKGDEVFFLTGTDEHGLKIFRAAEVAGKDTQSFVNENAESFRRLKKLLNLSWDDFIRTSDQTRHWPGAQKFWNKLLTAGDLYKKKYQGLYCVGCESFKTEKDLMEGRCPEHQKEPEKLEQENWFFQLSKYQKEIESRIKNDELRIIPESRKNEILSFIESGLEDVSFSRPKKDLSWGIPVPNDPNQTIYVWCDALTNYITALGYNEATSDKQQVTRFQKFWPADLHVIGKDISRFHAVIWPGMLLATGLALPRSIFAHGFVSVEGRKMSKSSGNIVDPVPLVKKYGTDALRYYLLREISSYDDGDFSLRKFEDRYTGDLSNGLGNLVARTVALGEKISPLMFDFAGDITAEVKEICGNVYEKYELALAEIKLHEAVGAIWSLISFGDRYINENKPWELKDAEQFRKVLANAGYLLGVVLNLAEPFLPETGEKIRKQIWFSHASENKPESTINFKKGENLFPRLN
ncbi:MAG: methionine--tRNA ligase [Patescibacteria group bacterium]